jgi:uncharacterized protein involved in response to NO
MNIKNCSVVRDLHTMKPSALPIMPASKADSGPPAALKNWPVLRLGFRPFYIGTALLACLSVPLWIATFAGWLTLSFPITALLWHAHEMLFGFAAGVIAGFLLTAVKAWTGLATPRGASLGALFVLWLAARIAGMTGPYVIYAALDVLLLPVVAVILLRVLIRAKNRKNLPLIGVLLLLGGANAAFHLSVMGVLHIDPVQTLYAGLAMIVMIESVMAGRVVPAFTMSVTPGLKIKIPRWSELTTLAVTAVALALWVLAPPGPVTFVACVLAAVLHAVRLAQWHPWVTRKRPILWILHLSYAWVVVGFVLLALVQLGWIAVSPAVHALAVGTTGGLIIGMITRTARGHTGRQLQVSSPEVLAYVLVMAAGLLRVLVPVAAPQWYVVALAVAALAWSLAFAIYLVIYTPWLLHTRADGKDG